MSRLNFRYCPVCGGELETGKIAFPSSYQISGSYYSDKITKELDGHPVKKMLRSPDKTFSLEWGADNPAGYCRKCGRIFAEFDVIGSLIDDEMLLTYEDYYEESADSLYDDKIVSYDDDINEKYSTIDGYTVLTDNIKSKKSED